MLLYVTTDEGKERKARPLHTIPDTVNRLYDLGQREHDRSALLLQSEGGGWADTPDWRFDREVIRIGLYARERVATRPGERVAILGPLRPLWLATDFAVQGIGGVSVGLCHALRDEEIVAALNEAGARLAVATDESSCSRLLSLRPRVASLATIIGPDGGPEDDPGFHPLSRVIELANTLDTAERANVFRETARAIGPDQPVLWHYAPGDTLRVARLTHREAMARVRAHLRRLPAQPGDKAYFEDDAVSMETRFAWYAFAGDGYTTMVLGRPSSAAGDVRDLRPDKVLASPSWLAGLWERVDAAPAGGVEGFTRGLPGLGWVHEWRRDLRWRRALTREAGDRLRWVQPLGPISDGVRQALSRFVTVVDSTGPMPVPEEPAPEQERGANPARLRTT